VITTRADDTTRPLNVPTCPAQVSDVTAVLDGRESAATSPVIHVVHCRDEIRADHRLSVYRAAASRRTSVCVIDLMSVVTVKCPLDAAVPLSVSTAPRALGLPQHQVGHRADVGLASKVRTVSVATSHAVTDLAFMGDSVNRQTIVPGLRAFVDRHTLDDAVKNDQAPLAETAVLAKLCFLMCEVKAPVTTLTTV